MSGQEIAFGARGEQLKAFRIRLKPELATALAQPAHQMLRIDRPYLYPGPVLLRGAHPVGALRVAIKTRCEDQQQDLRIARLDQRHERSAPGEAGLGARHARLEHAPIAEQRAVGGRAAQLVPVGGALDEMHLALAEARSACACAHRIRRLTPEQRLIP